MPLSAALNSLNSPLFRYASKGSDPAVLADIYQDEVNMAVWQRTPTTIIDEAVEELLAVNPDIQLWLTSAPKNVPNHLLESLKHQKLDNTKAAALAQDMANLVNMFCCLFELPQVGLRLTALDKAMCPRFHVDQVPARLITTYRGDATEWLEHEKVNRKMLGTGSRGIADELSGIYLLDEDIQQLASGDVALLKGEAWEGNEGAGLVHRSPSLKQDERRLLLTLDFTSSH